MRQVAQGVAALLGELAVCADGVVLKDAGISSFDAAIKRSDYALVCLAAYSTLRRCFDAFQRASADAPLHDVGLVCIPHGE